MIVKTYAIKWEEKILVTSQNKDTFVWYEFIQEEFPSEEHFKKIEAWYSYNIETWEFEETQESIEFEKQQIENQKKIILKELWELKLILNWMIEVWEDITEIDLKINELKEEYKSL